MKCMEMLYDWTAEVKSRSGMPRRVDPRPRSFRAEVDDMAVAVKAVTLARIAVCLDLDCLEHSS